MTRTAWIDSPLMVGFGAMQELAERAARGSDGYPPYNIEELDGARIRISLAVAGFSASELSTHVEGAQLVVRGRREEQQDRVFLHRGIATRRFQRAFVLADGFEVDAAVLEHGLLHIDIRRKPQGETIISIPITVGSG